MTEEEAIEKLKNGKKMELTTLIRTFKREGTENFIVTKREIIETVLKLLEKKDKIIDLMSYTMTHEEVPQNEYCVVRNIDCEVVGGSRECKDCIKQYFKSKVEKENE